MLSEILSGRRSSRIVLAVALLAVAACSDGGSAGGATTTPPTSIAPASSAPSTAPTTTAATTRQVDATAATSRAPTTTLPSTTTTPPLDRGVDAVTVRLEADLAVLAATGPRVAGSEAESETAAWLADEIGAITGMEATIGEVPLPGGSTSVNVWTPAVGRGTTVLLGGHIDSVPGSPGLDDNGSGTVVLLEMLRRLWEEPVDGLRVQIVFFGAEEVIAGGSADDHHFGSRHAAELLAADGALPDWMVSVDMVGVGADLVAAAYEGTDPAAAQLLTAAGSTVGVGVIPLDRGDISDHEAFARAGSNAAMLWRPDNPAWHTPADDTVSTDLLLTDLAVLGAFLDLVAGQTAP